MGMGDNRMKALIAVVIKPPDKTEQEKAYSEPVEDCGRKSIKVDEIDGTQEKIRRWQPKEINSYKSNDP